MLQCLTVAALKMYKSTSFNINTAYRKIGRVNMTVGELTSIRSHRSLIEF